MEKPCCQRVIVGQRLAFEHPVQIKRRPQRRVGKGAPKANPCLLVLRVWYARDRSADTLGGQRVSVFLSFYENEFASAFVPLIERQDSMAGCSRSRKAVEHDRV